MNAEYLFVSMLTESLDDLRSGRLPKGKFMGKYMAQLKEVAGEDAFRYKNPEVIGRGKEPDNNWLDYMMGLTDEEFMWFKNSLTQTQ